MEFKERILTGGPGHAARSFFGLWIEKTFSPTKLQPYSLLALVKAIGWDRKGDRKVESVSRDSMVLCFCSAVAHSEPRVDGQRPAPLRRQCC